MLVSEQYRKCVVYLCVDVRNKDTNEVERRPCGTAFLVGFQESGWSVLYLVTAQHVVSYSRPHGSLWVRTNMKDESIEDFETDQSAWETHPGSDVAIIGVPYGRFADADVVAVPVDWLLDDAFVERHEMGLGDGVFIPGLFSGLPGTRSVQPVVRFGALSLMPTEKIPVKLDPQSVAASDAFLIEVHSRGGMSGSPVFIVCDPSERENPVDPTEDYPMRILGLISGHYDVSDSGDFLSLEEQSGDARLNAGLAIVTPGQAIRELLEREDLVAKRASVFERGADS